MRLANVTETNVNKGDFRESKVARAALLRSEYKGRCRLWGIAFGIPRFTSEANIQDRCVGRPVWNSPIEIFGACRIHPRANQRSESPAAVQRQPDFLLTC